MRIALPAAALTLFATAAFVQPSYAQAPYGSPPPDQQGSPYQQGGPGQYDPQGAPPPGTYQGPPPGMQNQQSMGQPPIGQMRGREKFDAANVTHDGRLTRDQAAAGGLRAVARNFDAIDRDHKGYVTRQDLREWHQAKRAAMSGSQGPGGGPAGGPGPGQSMQGPPPQ